MNNYHGFFSTANWQIIIYTIATLYAVYVMSLKPERFFKGTKKPVFGWILVLFAWLYIGTRPLWAYSDTGLYTLMFKLVQSGYWKSLPGEHSEWLWAFVENCCIKLTDASGWLTVVSFGYVGCMAVAARRWFKSHFTLAILFLFTAFSFWSYGTNGIRNGMATSIMLLALSLVTPECRKNWIKLFPAIVLIILSCGTHNSMYLIAAVSLIAFFIPSRKAMFWIWGICLLLSPFTTNIIVSIVGSSINDGRISEYGSQTVSNKVFSRTGWRWDFILYSAMPVVLGYYVIVKKKFYDWKYIFLLSVYVYANSFWMLLNEIAYSNRFAYLSWFLYPVVLLFPLVRFRLWRKQPIVIGTILIVSIAFTLVFS